jgi:hypothetical protein
MKNLEHKPALHFTGDIIKRLNPELYQVGMDTAFVQSLSTDIDKWKHHTIRAGHRWKEGDWFSPRVWSGKSYASKQIQFAPDIQIKKIWNFDVDPWESYVINSKPLCYSEFKAVALNDGFTAGDDLELWLNVKRGEAFNGQIICWNENIEY